MMYLLLEQNGISFIKIFSFLLGKRDFCFDNKNEIHNGGIFLSNEYLWNCHLLEKYPLRLRTVHED